MRVLAAIHEQKILHSVVGDKQIHAAVVVDIGRDHAQAFAEPLPRQNVVGLSVRSTQNDVHPQKNPCGILRFRLGAASCF